MLPSIRKKGSYGQPQIDLNNPEGLRHLLLDYTEKVLTLQNKVAADEPKVVFFDNFINLDGLYNLQNAARAIGKQPNLFIRALKEKYLFYQGKTLVPYQEYVQRGVFEVRTAIIDEKARPQTFITPKGLQYFANKFSTIPVNTAIHHHMRGESLL